MTDLSPEKGQNTENTQKKRVSGSIPRSLWLPLTALVWNCLVYYGARLLAGRQVHYSLETTLDGHIPFLPRTVSIYLVSFLYWAVNYILIARREENRAIRHYCADFLSKCVCLLFFLFFPTTNTRPVLEGGGFWIGVMRLLYSLDSADNLFPSIHCIVSVLSALGLSGDKAVPRWYRCFSFLLAGAICVSTLTTRQHVLADVLFGVLLAVLCYALAEIPAVTRVYRLLLQRLGMPDERK